MGTQHEEAGGPGPIRLLVASDVRLYREGLVKSLGAVEGIEVVGSAKSSLAAAERVLSDPPEVLLLDMSMLDSVRTVTRITTALPALRVVAFAVAGDEGDVVSYVEAGVHGYVPRDGSVERLLSVIRHTARGEALCSPRVAGDAFRRLSVLAAGSTPHADLSVLTRREQEVIDLLAQGLSNKQIAQRLHIQVATVKNHVHNVLKKLDVKGRREAVRWVRTGGRKGTYERGERRV